MPDTEFTPKELEDLFDEPSKKPEIKIDKDLTRGKHRIDEITEPFLLDENDPKKPGVKKSIRDRSRKVLTTLDWWDKIKIPLNRKDDKMAVKAKTQTKYEQTVAVGLLAGGALLGFADQLGGGLKACLVSAILVVVLFVLAIDYRK